MRGLIDSPACQEALASKFGDGRVYSPTSLERYARCPYHFFLNDVLHLKKLEDPAAIEQLSALEHGGLMHAILCEFYGHMKAEAKLPLVQKHLELYRQALARICDQRFRQVEDDGATGFPAIWEVKQKLIRQDLDRFVVQEVREGGDWLPAKFELKFGDGEGGLALRAGDEAFRLKGGIDRLDLSPSEKAIRVIDYKSGKCHVKVNVDLAGGTALQLPLYLLAAASLYPGTVLQDSTAKYVFLTRKGDWKTCSITGAEVARKAADLGDILQTIVSGCRAGVFPRWPGDPNQWSCGDCEFARIGDPATRTHGAQRDSKLSDPRLLPFQQMREKV
jgi:ATP-dependent helicase/nuclease subunit B